MDFSLMNEGRPFTDYKTAAVINQNIKNKNKFFTNNEYRAYLKNNANKIIKHNFSEVYKLTPFTPEKQVYTKCPTKTNFVFTNIDDTRKPHNYESSDLKDFYLSKEQLNKRKNVTKLNQEQLLSHSK
jgi:hypothetical protein